MKILIVGDIPKPGMHLLRRAAEKLLTPEKINCTPDNLENLINSKRPDYVMLNVHSPADGDDMNKTIAAITSSTLSVSLYRIGK